MGTIFYDCVQGETWKRARSILAPTFSAAKMRKMSGKYKKITKDRIIKNFFKFRMCCGTKQS